MRTVWLTYEELQASAHLHRSPVVLQSIGDYLAGQRFDLNLIQADASIFSPPSAMAVPV